MQGYGTKFDCIEQLSVQVHCFILTRLKCIRLLPKLLQLHRLCTLLLLEYIIIQMKFLFSSFTPSSQSIIQSLFCKGTSNQPNTLGTPPRLSKLSLKNWRAMVSPFLDTPLIMIQSHAENMKKSMRALRNLSANQHSQSGHNRVKLAGLTVHGLLDIWTELLYLTFPHEADLLTPIMSHKLTQYL